MQIEITVCKAKLSQNSGMGIRPQKLRPSYAIETHSLKSYGSIQTHTPTHTHKHIPTGMLRLRYKTNPVFITLNTLDNYE